MGFGIGVGVGDGKLRSGEGVDCFGVVFLRISVRVFRRKENDSQA